MITIKSEREIELMKKAGSIVGATHNYLKPFIKPGITTKELDKLAYDFIISQDATPSFLNYEGFPATICTSINDEVVHGIPSKRKLKNGDIISVDIGACYKGYHGDSAWSYKVGSVSREKAYLLEHTKLGFCWWDLLALLILLAVVIVYLVRRHNLKKEQKDLEDQLSDLYAEDSVKENNTRVQE